MAVQKDLLKAKTVFSARLLGARAQKGGLFHRARTVNEATRAAGSNVHAVGVGKKIVDNKPTDELCVRFYVVQKLAPSLLSLADVLPAKIDGIVTDVIESPLPSIISNGTAAGPAVVAACSLDRGKEQRPIMGGISAAHSQVTQGTLACLCRSTSQGADPAKVYALSNNHVFGNLNQAMDRDDLLQPSPADGGLSKHKFAEFHRFVRVHVDGGITLNRVDAAIGELIPGIAFDPQICSVGNIAGLGLAQEGMTVCKHGRATGFTEGVIADESDDVTVIMDHNNPHNTALFQNQILITPNAPHPVFAVAGDSGSLLLNPATKEAIGLIFSMGPGFAIANRIQDVVADLQIELL